MSYRRYRFIGQFLSFDHSVTRHDRYQNDKFACYRVVFEALNKQNAIMRVPSLHMTTDEKLFPYRGHISIKNYNPNKPARYGLLFISISDAEVPYTYYSLPYAGKPEIPNEYYVPDTDEKSMYLVTKLRLYCDLTGRNITMDRYFTSLSIADWLLGRNMAVVGTMKDNRVGIPQK